ncbi:hypothetical protein [Porphyromonas sp.]|uniref:hypothetical protein n=5 Tax=Porphyromonas sp. TaxID=1924944 RepID=UPI003AAAA1C5
MKNTTLQKLTTLTITILVSLGCTRADLNDNPINQEESSIVKTTLYPRRTDAPIVLTLPSIEDESLRATDEALEPYLFFAKSYAPEVAISNSLDCFRKPIFDVERLLKKDSEVLAFTPLRRMEASYFSFTNTKSYEKHLKESNSNTTGLSINILGLFTIGTEKTISNSFNEDYTESNTNVYGIASINYDYGRYWFSSDAFTRREIRWNYLNKRFLNDLYGSPLAKNFGSRYGSLIADQLLVGANAEAIFYGTSKYARAQESQEKALNEVIHAGIKIPLKDDTIGANAQDSTGFSWSKKILDETDFSRINIVARTNGNGLQVPFSYPKSIKDFSVDFSPWFASLKGPEDFTITRTEQFKPLSEYIFEENFRQRIETQDFNRNFREPKIYITNGYSNVTPILGGSKELYVTLKTRYGDDILLRPIHADDEKWWSVESKEELDAKARELAGVLKDRYNLEIVSYYQPPIRRIDSGEIIPLTFNPESIRGLKPHYDLIQIPFYGMNEMKMTKCYHKGYKMDFLLYDGGKGRRYAFAIYDKSFIGTYGLEKIYQRAPLVDFPEEYIIDNYVVVGL